MYVCDPTKITVGAVVLLHDILIVNLQSNVDVPVIVNVVLPETDAKKEKAITTVIQFTTVLAQVVSALATISLLKK